MLASNAGWENDFSCASLPHPLNPDIIEINEYLSQKSDRSLRRSRLYERVMYLGVVKALLAREEKIAMKLGVLTIFKTVGD